MSGNFKLIKLKKYVEKPPDGGYGYVICLVVCIDNIICYSFSNCFGFIYNDFLEDLGEGSTGISTIQGITSIVLSLSGIFTNIALRKFSLRQLALFGGMLCTAGWFLNIFVTTIYQMFFTCGFLQSIGVGITATVFMTAFNQYFEKNRFLAMGVCQIVISVASIFVPIFIKYCLQNYGFRGTLLLISGLIGQSCMVALLIHPVKWHMRKELIVDDEDAMLDEHMRTQMEGGRMKIEEVEIKECEPNTQISSQNSNSMKETKHDVGNPGTWKRAVEFLDISLISDPIYMNLVLGTSIGSFTDQSFIFMFPLYLSSVGFSKEDVSTCLYLLAAGDSLARASLTLFAKFCTMRSRTIYFHCVIAAMVARIVFLQFLTRDGIMVTSCIMGYIRGLTFTPMSLILMEYIPDKFTAAFGLSVLISGVTNTVLYPIAGFIRDYFQSYIVLFYTLSFLNLACIVPWTIEFLLCGKTKKKK